VSFLAGLSVGAALAFLTALAASRRRDRRLAGYARAAWSLARGDLEARCEPGGPPGHEDLGRAINEAAEVSGQRLAELTEERDTLASMLRGMEDGVLVADARQKVILANPSAARLLGFPLPAEGKLLWELIRQEAFLKESLAAAERPEPRAVRLDVDDRHLAVSMTPLPMGRFLAVVHDATESARYQGLRKEFVANVSHELRTPLTLIRGCVETLQEGAFHDPVKGPEFLGIVAKNAAMLTNLVEDILDLSKLESPQGLPRKLRVDLRSTIQRVLEMRMPFAQKRNQSLTADVGGALPGVIGDPDYLERALSNLVDNAVKYTPEKGNIRVSARGEGTTVVLEVKDDGIGIPESDLPRIFERFYRVDKSRSREMGGTGLGLSIVKHVVQAHGGSVEVESRPGQGSLFRVILPAEPRS
jgi:two-component system phosphate regulon sensor histidine kinase PhoR